MECRVPAVILIVCLLLNTPQHYFTDRSAPVWCKQWQNTKREFTRLCKHRNNSRDREWLGSGQLLLRIASFDEQGGLIVLVMWKLDRHFHISPAESNLQIKGRRFVWADLFQGCFFPVPIPRNNNLCNSMSPAFSGTQLKLFQHFVGCTPVENWGVTSPHLAEDASSDYYRV